ncbi:AI-2E family transporter [Haloprofundus salinisoli]|uniref:AI-2E family transporter n=1 Tax=Haloprofundus salinisoli TaxID=2876193 RepID=UPI001CCE1FB9|nr:AI-2E family transporter [Haloprofundus salinisoli]
MQRDRAFLLFAIGIVGVLSALLLFPFLQYILAAVLLAYVLKPVHRRLEPRIGSRIAAAALIVVSTLAVLLPIALVVQVVLQEARSVVTAVRDLLSGSTPFGELAQMGLSVEALFGSAEGSGSTLVGSVVDVFGGLSNAVIGLTVLLFLLYYLLTDGTALVAWIRRAIPLPSPIQDELHARIDRLMWAVLVGNVLVAIVQGILTGIGFVIVGFPSAIFWTVFTVLLSLLPLIGASIVWFPAAVYLGLTGRYVSAGVLFVYGAVVVSLSDNYLRPVIGGREAHLNPGLFVVGIFGGVAAFGFMGIFFGPIILGVLKTLVDVYVREYAGADQLPVGGD